MSSELISVAEYHTSSSEHACRHAVVHVRLVARIRTESAPTCPTAILIPPSDRHSSATHPHPHTAILSTISTKMAFSLRLSAFVLLALFCAAAARPVRNEGATVKAAVRKSPSLTTTVRPDDGPGDKDDGHKKSKVYKYIYYPKRKYPNNKAVLNKHIYGDDDD
eukprot:IDg12529t1